MEYYVQLWIPLHKKDMHPLEQEQRRAIKMIRGMEHLSCEDSRRELGLFILEKTRLQGCLRAAFWYLKGAYKEAGKRLFMRAYSDKAKGNGFKLKEGRITFGIRKKFFTVRVVKHWHGLPREAVAAPTWKCLRPGWMEL